MPEPTPSSDRALQALSDSIGGARTRRPEDATDPAIPVAATVVLLRDAGDGLEVLMIERPDRGSFAGAWVFRRCFTHGARAQTIAISPFGDDMVTNAIIFDCLLVSRLKHCLPWQTEAIVEVAHVHPLLFGKTFPDLWIDALVNPAHVSDRSLTTAIGRHHAEEEDL